MSEALISVTPWRSAPVIGETRASRRELRRSEGLRARLARWDLTRYYGLFAVLVVASVQLFFSLDKGGFFPEQWFWGVAAVAVALVGAALVPGYFSSPFMGRKQWALAGALLLLLVVVAASVLWSIRPGLSILEASRTAMYVGAFILLLPAAIRWGWLIVDTIIFGALLPPALYGLLQKILPTSIAYTGYDTLETDPQVSSTVGYHATFGLMCAMGALLVIARVESLRSASLRALYSATGVLFLVALYFSFSRGALAALAIGAVVLMVLAKHRFEVLANMLITGLPALWVVSQAQEYPGLVTRPVSFAAIETDGLALIEPLLKGVLVALAAQALFAGLVQAFIKFVPGQVRSVLRITGTIAAAGVVVWGLFLGWAAFQQAGGYDELKSRITAPTESNAQAFATDGTQRFSSLSAIGRMGHWKVAWENWRKHPLTGTGGDTFQVIWEKKAPEGWGPVLHPHSMWLSLLSDTGIFAFLAFAAFCLGFLALAVYDAFFGTSSRRDRALLTGSTAAAAAYLVSSSIDWNWYIPASTLPFFALVAVTMGVTSQSANPKSGRLS